MEFMQFALQVFQTTEPLSSQLRAMATGQAELPQAAGQVPVQPAPVNAQSAAQAAAPTPGLPAAAAPTQVSQASRSVSATAAFKAVSVSKKKPWYTGHILFLQVLFFYELP